MTETIPLAERLRAQEATVESMVPAETFTTFANDAASMGREVYAARAIQPGERAPDFTLPDVEGDPVSLADLLRQGPVVVTFFRGTWCPYCNVQLHVYQESLAEIRKAGAHLVAVSPQTPDQSQIISENNRLSFPVLSDAGNRVAQGYVPIFSVADAPRVALRGLGISLAESNGDESNVLPCRARSSSTGAAWSASRSSRAISASASIPRIFSTLSAPWPSAERRRLRSSRLS